MKPLHWIGDSKKCVKEFPEEVQREIGFTLYLAQLGGKAMNAVPLVGFCGAKVLELVIDDSGDAYRAVYTIKFEMAVYSLHAFQKKSKKGKETPKHDIKLIRARLKKAEQHYKETYLGACRKDSRHGTDGRYRKRSDRQ